MDFTLNKYIELLDAIKKINTNIYGISEWNKIKPNKGILIRHDVDRKPKNALKVAKIEAEMGIYTTYYFRITPNSYHPQIIKELTKLGHEIGYHYEDLSLAGGDFVKAKALFVKHLAMLRKFCKVKTIAMHGRPLSKFDNRDLWKKFDFSEYGIESEAFLSIDYKDIYYFTDTGRSWSNKAINLRDKTESLRAEVQSTDELIKFIKQNKSKKIAIVSHPERWNENKISWVLSFSQDLIFNTIKKGIRTIRKK